jgi:hypothetical protein
VELVVSVFFSGSLSLFSSFFFFKNGESRL